MPDAELDPFDHDEVLVMAGRFGSYCEKNLALKPLRSFARSPKTGDPRGRSDVKKRDQGPDSPLVGAEVLVFGPNFA